MPFRCAASSGKGLMVVNSMMRLNVIGQILNPQAVVPVARGMLGYERALVGPCLGHWSHRQNPMHLMSADLANLKYSSVISPLYPVSRSVPETDRTWYVMANACCSGS